MITVQSATDTRANFKHALDAAESGVSWPMQRAGHYSAIVDATRLRDALAALVHPNVEVFHENEWVAVVKTIPSILATGDTFDEAVNDLISAAREYAFDWNDHLRHAPNHADNWDFVQVVMFSDDDALRDWLTR